MFWNSTEDLFTLAVPPKQSRKERRRQRILTASYTVHTMKIDMKKDSPFRMEVYPKILFGVGVAVSAIIVAISLLLHPDIRVILLSLAVLAAGIAVGFLYVAMLVKKVPSKRAFLTQKAPSAIVWILILICILFTDAAIHWAFQAEMFILGYSIGYFIRFLPRMIEINREILASRSRTPD